MARNRVGIDSDELTRRGREYDMSYSSHNVPCWTVPTLRKYMKFFLYLGNISLPIHSYVCILSNTIELHLQPPEFHSRGVCVPHAKSESRAELLLAALEYTSNHTTRSAKKIICVMCSRSQPHGGCSVRPTEHRKESSKLLIFAICCSAVTSAAAFAHKF